MPEGPTHDAIAQLAKAIQVGRWQLAGLIVGACPSRHLAVQHRDGRPPWCKACRYTDLGEYVPCEQES